MLLAAMSQKLLVAFQKGQQSPEEVNSSAEPEAPEAPELESQAEKPAAEESQPGEQDKNGKAKKGQAKSKAKAKAQPKSKAQAKGKAKAKAKAKAKGKAKAKAKAEPKTKACKAKTAEKKDEGGEGKTDSQQESQPKPVDEKKGKSKGDPKGDPKPEPPKKTRREQDLEKAANLAHFEEQVVESDEPAGEAGKEDDSRNKQKSWYFKRHFQLLPDSVQKLFVSPQVSRASWQHLTIFYRRKPLAPQV